jgi:hydrogenase maturation protease
MGDAVVVRVETSSRPSRRGIREVLVLGLGNTLLADDGVGVHVVRHLENDPDRPSGLSPLDGGTLGFRLLGSLTQSNAVLVVDAAELGEPPGTVRLLDQHALADHVSRGGRMSAHEAGLVDLLTLARLEGWAPTRLALLGIQPQRIEWDEALSAPVSRSVPAACRVVVETVLAWQAAP